MRSSKRRATLLVLAVALAAGVVWIGAARGAPAPGPDPVLSALGERPLVVVRVPSVAALQEQAMGTRWGRHVEESLLLSGLRDMKEGASRFFAGLLTDFSAAELERLQDREVAVVVFPPYGGKGVAPPAACAVHLGGDAAAVKAALRDQVLPRLEAMNAELRISEEPGGDGLLRLEGRKGTGYARFAGDLLLVGNREGVLKFEPGRGGQARLAEAPDALASLYIDAGAVWQFITAAMSGRPQELKEFEATGVTGIQSVLGTTDVVAGGFRDVVSAELSPDVSGWLQMMLAPAAGRPGAVGVVPRDYSLAASLQIESGETLYGLIEEMVRRQEGEGGLQQFRAGMDQVDQAFTINVEFELVPTIGSEVFLAMKMPEADLLASGVEPRWADFQALFGFRVRDEEALKELIERFAASLQAAQQGWQLLHGRQGGVEVYTLHNIAGPFEVSFAFVTGFLVCATEAEPVHRAIDAVAEGATLAATPDYRAVAEQLPAEGNMAVYMNTAPVRQTLAAVAAVKAPSEKRAFLPVLERALPDLGGYGMAVVRDQAGFRVEGYGDLPVTFGFYSLLTLGAFAR